MSRASAAAAASSGGTATSRAVSSRRMTVSVRKVGPYRLSAGLGQCGRRTHKADRASRPAGEEVSAEQRGAPAEVAGHGVLQEGQRCDVASNQGGQVGRVNA